MDASAITSHKSYFEYHRQPKKVSIEDYLGVFRTFCRAYDIKETDYDITRFSTLVQLHIIGRKNPEGVDYRPQSADARIFISPKHGSVAFYSHSYGSENKYPKFEKLADEYLTNQRMNAKRRESREADS